MRGATDRPPSPEKPPKGFVGELREYQAEALGWLAFLDRAGLGGCLAMDMGLGKTPTLLAHLLVTKGQGPVLVVAPPAVLGNWAEEAARFTPKLKVHVHHGGARAGSDEIDDVVAGSDLVLTTFGTAVRDVEALAKVDWQRFVVDEAAGHQEPGQRDRPAAAAHPGPLRRLALTGTPIENGLGDLWSILDFTNPGLVGPGRRSSDQFRQRQTAATGRRGGAAGAQRSARVPAHQGRAGDRGRAPRPHRRARPLHA